MEGKFFQPGYTEEDVAPASSDITDFVYSPWEA